MPNVFENYWTQQQLCHIFDRTLTTIWNWRKNKELPFENFGSEKMPIVRFKKTAVRRWARKHGLGLVHDPDSILGKRIRLNKGKKL